jgi:uncharacterized protein (DUF2141 family)
LLKQINKPIRMKKTLLFFLLLFTTTFYGQVSNLEGCQNFPKFDLTIKNTELIGNLNPNTTTVSYHLSLADANNNANAISDPTAYSSPNPTTIYARINNNDTISTNYFNLTFGPPLQVLWTQIVQTCLGYSQENITMMVTGGKGPYFYSLDYGQNYTYLRNFHLEPGNYTVLVKDSNNCPASNPVFMEVQPTRFLTAAATVTEGVNCGDSDSVTITATGGQGSYTYSFDGINYSNLNTTNNLKTGTSILYVKDQNNCIANTTATVNNYKYDFNSAVVIKQISCLDEKGSIIVQGMGGKSPYLYSLNGASYDSKNTFDNLTSGVYQINTKDALGCVSSFYAVINSFEPLIVDASSINVSCYGDSNGSIKINARGGSGAYTYSVSKNNIQIISNTTNNVFNNLSAGSYTITITDPNTACTALMEVYILEPATPLTAIFTVENQTLTINASGGSGEIIYALSPNLDKFSTQNVFQNLVPGNYTAIVQDANGCGIIYNVIIDVPAPLINGKNTITIEFQAGQTLADLVVEGQNIKWYSNPNSLTGKTNKISETTLPLTTALVNETTYYASQTINGIESTKRLAVTAKSNGSLSAPDFTLPNFSYYPNPVQHTLSISNTSNIDEVEIFSVSGKTILTKKINSDHSEIDLSNLSSGFYFLKVKAEGKTKTIKIVKK